MTIKLSDIISEKRWVTVDVSGFDVRVAYTPNTITLRRSEELSHLLDSIDSNPDIRIGEETARMFCDLVSEWDILGDDDRPFPITVEALQDFPANILQRILEGVQADVAGHEESKKASSVTSDVGSQPMGSLAPVQNGFR